jgi:FlaA1/EpsC-like NDP-sugar epimerase
MHLDIEGFLRRYRAIIEPIADCVIWVSSLVLATELRFQFQSGHALTLGLLEASAVVVVAQLGIGWIILYRVRWKNASFEQIVALATTITAATVVLLVTNALILRHPVPISAIVAAGAFTFIGGTGARGWRRIIYEYRFRQRRAAKRAIVFGAGDGGAQIINSLLKTHDSRFITVALLDDSPSMRKTRIRHLRVSGGREQLGDVARQLKADTLIIAIPSASSALIRELSNLAGKANLDVCVLPPVSELLAQRSVGVANIRTLTEEDLMGRHAIETDVDAIAGYLTGSRVLVTGAGGSIGSELCRQISGFSPAELVMLDRDESGLHGVQLSIEGAARLDSRNLVVCNIEDLEALNNVFDEYRPEVVFHAAALKHLPLLEMWPAEAVKINVFGTRNVLSAAARVGTKRFVNVSTDKAADPSSVLGYTKRIGERLTATTAAGADGTYLSVRFGNVLGSRGSAIPMFRAQIATSGPVTVTHPDVTRYFMTVQEAVQLVVQAGAIGGCGEVLVFDMGTPVRIVEVAKRLVDDADGSIEIVFTGLRPGEKLHEVLFGHDEVDVRPKHPLISHVRVPPMDTELVDYLTASGSSGLSSDPSVVREVLAALCSSPAPSPETSTGSRAASSTFGGLGQLIGGA